LAKDSKDQLLKSVQDGIEFLRSKMPSYTLLTTEVKLYLVECSNAVKSVGTTEITNGTSRKMWCRFEELDCGFAMAATQDLSAPRLVHLLQSGESAKFRVTATPVFVRDRGQLSEKPATTVRANQTVAFWGCNPKFDLLEYPNMKKKLTCFIDIPNHMAESVSLLIKVELV
jgi:hypothetical protein